LSWRITEKLFWSVFICLLLLRRLRLLLLDHLIEILVFIIRKLFFWRWILQIIIRIWILCVVHTGWIITNNFILRTKSNILFGFFSNRIRKFCLLYLIFIIILLIRMTLIWFWFKKIIWIVWKVLINLKIRLNNLIWLLINIILVIVSDF